MKSIALVCDVEAVRRLRLIAKLWPQLVAAQQSNLLHAALADYREPGPNNYSCRHVTYNPAVMDAVSRTRLKQLAELWPGLSPAVQCVIHSSADDAVRLLARQEQQERFKAAAGRPSVLEAAS